MQRLKSGLNVPYSLCPFNLLSWNSMGSLYFVWSLESSDSVETVFQKSLPVVNTVKSLLPQCQQEQCIKHSCQSMAVLQVKFTLHF